MAGILLEGPNYTDEQRANHARALAAEQREASLQRAAKVKARVGDKKLTRALSIDGRVLCDQIVDAGARCFDAIVSQEERLQLGARHLGAASHGDYGAVSTFGTSRGWINIQFRYVIRRAAIDCV